MNQAVSARVGSLWKPIASSLAAVLPFIGVLSLRTPPSIARFFAVYSAAFFVLVVVLFYLCLRTNGTWAVCTSLALTAMLFALPLAYKWASGFSDNFLIGGLLPYKDAKNYYYGANLILHGLPLDRAGQATERPVFAGFLSVILLLARQDFKLALAIMTGLVGLLFYLSVRVVRATIGAVAAAVYATLTYFYFQPMIGYNMSELVGFGLGCLAFALLFRAAQNPNYLELFVGLACMLMAVSARAGTFLIFPLLVLWSGLLMRGTRSYSFRAALLALLVLGCAVLVVDVLYPRLLGVPPGSAFGNFSLVLYGQVHGGTGWHKAIEDLGTRDPAIVYRATWQFFLAHPLSLFIGAAKSYAEFFLPGAPSIFAFPVSGDLAGLMFWTATVILLLAALVGILRTPRDGMSSLMLAGFVGILLSIPFLPPIDGGARFYASTVQFLFVLPAFGIPRRGLQAASILERPRQNPVLWYSAAAVLAVIIVVPILIRDLARHVISDAPSCPAGQQAFAAEVSPNSYIDLIPDGLGPCGLAPRVCLSNFRSNGAGDPLDDFYVKLMSLTGSATSTIRLVPSTNMLGSSFHYFVMAGPEVPQLRTSSTLLVSGCATEIRTQNQSIFQVESMELPRP